MAGQEPVDPRRTIGEIAARHAGLTFLALFGSRARGDAGAWSDWDLGYLADSRFRPEAMMADLVDALRTERIDLVDLDRGGALLRYRAARDGVVLFAGAAGAFERFWLDAVTAWCDMQPVIAAGYADVLAQLDR